MPNPDPGAKGRPLTEAELYRQALSDIVNPIGRLERYAEASGTRLDGEMAHRIASSASYLRGIAREALDDAGRLALTQSEPKDEAR